MTRLGGLERRLGRLAVAELADQDHVRVLPQDTPKRLVERLGVDPDLALVHDAPVVVVEELDRILDRDDVLPAGPVDVRDHRGERRRLADAGGAGDEDQPAVLLGQLLDAGGQAQALEVGNLVGDDAERERDLAALAERVDAEARQAVGLVGGVELTGLVEGGEPRPRRGADEREHLLERGRIEHRPTCERLELAVAADDRRPAGLEVDVARVGVDDAAKQVVQIHAGKLLRCRVALLMSGALLAAKKAAPGRAEAAVVLSLREHVAKSRLRPGLSDSPIGLVGATRPGRPR